MWLSYLINLAENKERLANCTRQLEAQNIAFKRVEAVNGRQLSQDQINQLYDAKQNKRKAKHDLVPSEIGCYASHLDAWRLIADGDDAGGFILEDDFEAHESLGAILSQLSQDGAGWDIVKLFSFDQHPQCVARSDLDETHQLVTPYKVPSCTLGYGITKKAAQHLLSVSPPFYRPIDEDHKFFWEKDLDIRLVLPSPLKVGDQQTQTGTIGDHRKKAAQQFSFKNLTSPWRKWRYQVSYRSGLKSARQKAHQDA